MPITIRVRKGNCWPTSSNCSTTLGTTKIIRAKTTIVAKSARMIG